MLPLSALFRHSDGSRTFHRTSLGTLTSACAGPLALCCSFACSNEQATEDLASPAGGSSFAAAGGQPNGTGGALIEVNRDGSGDFTTVQAAFNSVATSNTTPTIVRIAPGQR
ncbi:hypothetical protein BE20_04690 [Sorangium cellulosum]|uniref:Uncharacterized protein n=1 Tax=Sorangium cellulosum TaxID=56 RepID=A0A150SB80_SORCE|nr:hypothetical protein BE18_47095 [Sorangium cellulosum]KYF95597.1 hypothetical protein BE20_04690 [Sorangium cellulosum]